MSSETTIRQIERIDAEINDKLPSVGSEQYLRHCQAKLNLLQCLEIQERMEREAYYAVGQKGHDGSAGGGE